MGGGGSARVGLLEEKIHILYKKGKNQNSRNIGKIIYLARKKDQATAKWGRGSGEKRVVRTGHFARGKKGGPGGRQECNGERDLVARESRRGWGRMRGGVAEERRGGEESGERGTMGTFLSLLKQEGGVFGALGINKKKCKTFGNTGVIPFQKKHGRLNAKGGTHALGGKKKVPHRKMTQARGEKIRSLKKKISYSTTVPGGANEKNKFRGGGKRRGKGPPKKGDLIDEGSRFDLRNQRERIF